MKKYLIILTLLLLPLSSLASGDENVWSYLFHLEVRNGTLSVAQGTKFSYDVIPVRFSSTIDISAADYYGVVVNVKGKSEATFGVPKVTKVDLATNASPLETRGPHFADADHVSFYTKSGKHLFDISVKGSSFCNDNGKCDAAVGENYLNCPADCKAPEGTVAPAPQPLTPPAPHPIVASTTPPPVVQEKLPEVTATDSAYVVKTEGVAPAKQFDIKTILSFVGGILLIVLSFVFYRVRKNSE